MSDDTSAHALPPWFVAVRHGETAWSATGRHTSTTDVDLTEHGRERAALLAEYLQQWIDPTQAVVFSSPRQRALATAELAVPGVALRVTDLLVEVDYGDYEGLTNAEIQESRPGWELFRDGCPGGEPIADAGARADGFVELATEHSAGRPVLLFSHGHFGRILTARLLGLDASQAMLLYNDTGSVGVVMLRRGSYVLDAWNTRPPL